MKKILSVLFLLVLSTLVYSQSLIRVSQIEPIQGTYIKSLGETVNKVLTTNGSGAATWQTQSFLPSSGGLTNYVAKWTSSSALGYGVIYDNGTNLGIGTAFPSLPLTISAAYGLPATTGSTQSGGMLRLANNTGNIVLDFGQNGSGGGWLQSTNSTNLSFNYPLLLNPNGGMVKTGKDGIGTFTTEPSIIGNFYGAQSPWLTNGQFATGLQYDRLQAANTRYTITTTNLTTPNNAFDANYDSRADVINVANPGIYEIDFAPQQSWTPNGANGYVYSNGFMVIQFYSNYIPNNIKVELYGRNTVTLLDEWVTVADITGNTLSNVKFSTLASSYVYFKKIKITFSVANLTNIGIASIEWFPSRQTSGDLSVIPMYSGTIFNTTTNLRFRDNSFAEKVLIDATSASPVVVTGLTTSTTGFKVGATTDLNTLGSATGVFKFETAAASATNLPIAALDNANGVLTFNTFNTASTNYAKQLAWVDNSDIYTRNVVSNSYGAWYKLYHSGNSNLGTVTWNAASYSINGANINTANTLTNVAYKGTLTTGYLPYYNGIQLENSPIYRYSPTATVQGATSVYGSTGSYSTINTYGNESSVFAGYSAGRFYNDAYGATHWNIKSRGSTVGTHAVVQSADIIGSYIFEASDGTAFFRGAKYNVVVDAAPTTGIVPMRFEWITRNTAGSLAERMRLDNSGNLGIGTTPTAGKLHVYTTSAGIISALESTGSSGYLQFRESGVIRGYLGYGDNGNILTGATSNSISLRSDADLHLAGSGNNLTMTLTGGNVGIGTTAPSERLVVENTSKISLRITSTENNIRFQHTTASNPTASFGFSTGGNTGLLGGLVFSAYTGTAWQNNMFISNTGNVGIGTTAPAAKLEVSGGAYNTALKVTSSETLGTGINLTNTSVGGVGYSIFSSGSTQSIGAGHLAFYKEGIGYRMVIKDNGNVGIGTTAPEGKLQIDEYTVGANGNQTIFGTGNIFTNTGTDALYLGIKNHAYPNRGWAFRPVTNGVNSDLQIYEHGMSGARVTFQSGGNVGIGTTAPWASAKLDVVGNINIPVEKGYYVNTNRVLTQTVTGINGQTGIFVGMVDFYSKISFDNNNSGTIKFLTGNTAVQRMTILGDGNVGIGTTTPGEKLEVNGNVRITGNTPTFNFYSNLTSTPANGTKIFQVPFVGWNGSATDTAFTISLANEANGVFAPASKVFQLEDTNDGFNNMLLRISSSDAGTVPNLEFKGNIAASGKLAFFSDFTGDNIYDNPTIYIKRDGSNAMAFTDVSSGTTTLPQLRQAYDNQVTAIGFSGSSTKTLTITQTDLGTLTASFTDEVGYDGGDEVQVNSASTVNPDFVTSGSISFVNTANTITANLNSIGTITPGAYTNANLTVGGDGRITLISNGSGGSSNWTNGTNFSYFTDSGDDLGVGYTTDQGVYKLQVNGAIKANGSINGTVLYSDTWLSGGYGVTANEIAAKPSTPLAGTGQLYVKTDSRPYFQDDSGVEFALGSWLTDANGIYRTGNVGIGGASSSSYNLSVTGSIYSSAAMTSGTTITASSFMQGTYLTAGTNYSSFTPSTTAGGIFFAMNDQPWFQSNNANGNIEYNLLTAKYVTSGTPASATATGTAGEIKYDASYIYMCTATNTWKRTAISTW